MPFQRFRRFEDASLALRSRPGDPALVARMTAVWSLTRSTLAAAPAPRGIRRFRTLEEAQEDRRASDLHRILVLRERRAGSSNSAASQSPGC